MLVLRIWYHLVGFLEIRIEGFALEKFLNLAVSRGIRLWDIRFRGEVLQARLPVTSFRDLHDIARRTRSRVRIIRRLGLPFLLARARRRKILVGGALLFFVSLFLLSSLVLFIEVKPGEAISEEQILAWAAEAGLAPGVWKWDVDLDKVERHILQSSPRLSWVGITQRGTRIIIEIVEKTIPPELEFANLPNDITASRDGRVITVLVLSGQARVKEGDYVKRGQTLIAGTALPGQTPRARGVVKARTWYEGYTEIPTFAMSVVETGATYQRTVIKVNKMEIVIQGRKEIPFQNYQVEERVVTIPRWRNVNIPVEFKYVTYREVHRIKVRLGSPASREEARRKLVNKLRSLVPAGGEIISIRDYLVQERDDLVGVRVVIEAEEDIGRVQYRSPAVEPGQAQGR